MTIATDAQQRAHWLHAAGRILLEIDDLMSEITVALNGQVPYMAMLALVESDADLDQAKALIALAARKIARIP